MNARRLKIRHAPELGTRRQTAPPARAATGANGPTPYPAHRSAPSFAPTALPAWLPHPRRWRAPTGSTALCWWRPGERRAILSPAPRVPRFFAGTPGGRVAERLHFAASYSVFGCQDDAIVCRCVRSPAVKRPRYAPFLGLPSPALHAPQKTVQKLSKLPARPRLWRSVPIARLARCSLPARARRAIA